MILRYARRYRDDVRPWRAYLPALDREAPAEQRPWYGAGACDRDVRRSVG
jgi:hypothetical protein